VRAVNPLYLHARSGSRIVSRYQRRLGKGSAGAVMPPPISSQARFKAVPLNSGDWTAVTTGYPDAPHDGTPTYYQADAAHNLGNARAQVVGMQDADGRTITARIVEVSNEDPSNPGNLLYNSSRIWISADAAPSADIYVNFVG
jgi:hypothetical protein